MNLPGFTAERSVGTCFEHFHLDAVQKTVSRRETISLAWIQEKYIESGSWRTVERFWNARATAFFRAPRGARIRVRYGLGFARVNRQTQTLDGREYKRLRVGVGSFAYARMQVRVAQSSWVKYDLLPGSVAVTTPSIAF